MSLLRALGALFLALFGIAAFTPAVALLARWSIPDRPAERAEAIVVLGNGGVAPGGVKDCGQDFDSGDRLVVHAAAQTGCFDH